MHGTCPKQTEQYFMDKLLISFDNIEGAMRAIREAVQQKIDSDKLPLNKRDYLELVEKCMKFGSFTFNNREYHQHEGLPMGSPLSARKLNDNYDKIQLTVEEENNGQLRFLDTVIIRSANSAKFKVYRNQTNKDNYIHIFSAHDDRTKSRVVIGFYIRALHICSEEYLTEELNYITAAFKTLKYPKGMLRSSL
ncbi:uncharacterized protein LOC143017952 [Oratosquilla oratoria]|uniref:uncharacterized protein LOC143017952 n=1 Tax=Oratosquilla oratoria TaxID=337810 RepID=UPI003F7676CF